MTKKFVLSKLSNSDIDSLVATYVMNWACVQDEDNPYAVYIDQNTRHIKKHVDNFNPSEDISDAWDIAEKFASDGWEVTVEKSTIDGLEKLAWRCWLNYFTDNPEEHRNAEGVSDFAPRAICVAALLATSREFVK